jgi:hypothetical protein
MRCPICSHVYEWLPTLAWVRWVAIWEKPYTVEQLLNAVAAGLQATANAAF